MKNRQEERKRVTKKEAEQMGLQPEQKLIYQVSKGLPGIPQSQSWKNRYGKVIALYPYHFVVQWGDAPYQECFFYELLLGLEDEQIKMV